jgi:SAM-dependent methyltransferase
LSFKQELLFQLIKRGLRYQHLFSRQFNRLESFLGGVALGGLENEFRQRITSAIYNSRGDYQQVGLFKWEETWFSEDLPRQPAKILVGGAGTGREVDYLDKLGHNIVAFDPAASFVKKGQNNFAGKAGIVFFRGSYEELADAEHDYDNSIYQAVKSQAPFDAVLLGWGSYTHVSSEHHRIALLKCLRELCPGGPLLLSFWMRGDDTQIHKGRTWNLGWKVGRFLAGKDAASEPGLSGDVVSGQAGYGHFFTLEELEEIASAAGYRLSRSPRGAYSGAYPHATLRPKKQ